MTREVPESHPLHRLFRGMTESTFMTELGIGDPRLVGYVANLLARFVPSQTIWRLRDGQGRRLTAGHGDARRGRVDHRRRSPARVPPPRRRLHALLDGRLSRGAPQAASRRLARQPDRLPAPGQTIVLPGQHPRRRRGPRPPPPERRVRALRLRPLAGPPRVGEARPGNPGRPDEPDPRGVIRRDSPWASRGRDALSSCRPTRPRRRPACPGPAGRPWPSCP